MFLSREMLKIEEHAHQNQHKQMLCSLIKQKLIKVIAQVRDMLKRKKIGEHTNMFVLMVFRPLINYEKTRP